MTTLTIEIPETSKKTLTELIQQLGGKVITTEPKLTRKEKEFLKGFDEAIDFVNQHKPQNVKAKSIDELLNEL